MSLGVDFWDHIFEVLPSDTWYQEVRVEIEFGNTLEGRFSGYSLESDGLFRQFGCIYVLVPGDLCTLILSEAHSAPYFAHLGVKKIHVDLK